MLFVCFTFPLSVAGLSRLPLDDSTYASVNHETTSNHSRPSRVRRYHDSDSEITSISSQYRGMETQPDTRMLIHTYMHDVCTHAEYTQHTRTDTHTHRHTHAHTKRYTHIAHTHMHKGQHILTHALVKVCLYAYCTYVYVPPQTDGTTSQASTLLTEQQAVATIHQWRLPKGEGLTARQAASTPQRRATRGHKGTLST